MVTDRGIAVALYTHKARLGNLVWVSEEFFDEEPTIETAQKVTSWRWCIFTSVGPGIKRGDFFPLGVIPVPPELQQFPPLRMGGGPQDWGLFLDGDLTGLGKPCKDRTVNIAQWVDTVRLKEMLVTGWRPEDQW